MKTVFLGDVSEINPKIDGGLQDDALCSFVPMEYVEETFGTIRKTDIRTVGEVKKGYTFFKNDDVLFAKITPCMENGKCALAKNLTNGIAFGSTEYHVVRASNDIIPEWIYYFLRQGRIRQDAKQWFRGTAGQQRVPCDFLEQAKISLPALSEQQRMTAILQKADRLRRLRRHAHQLSDTYLQSVFFEMFGDPATNPKGWDKAYIDDVVYKSQYGTSNKSNHERRGYPILGMGNITFSGELDLSALAYVDLTEKEFAELKLEEDDIIFNRTNSTELVGKTAKWNANIDAVLASYLVKLKLADNITPDFFVTLLNTSYYKKMFQERCKKAVGQSNVSPTLLQEFPIFLPPIVLQLEFSKILTNTLSIKGKQIESERLTEHLFQSLLQRAFQGEL